MYLIYMNISGCDFTADIISRIQTEIDSRPELSRVQLSRAVCGILDWRSVTGKLKEMSCRVALLKLERRGKLRLPAARPFRSVSADPRPKIVEQWRTCHRWFTNLTPCYLGVHYKCINESVAWMERHYETLAKPPDVVARIETVHLMLERKTYIFLNWREMPARFYMLAHYLNLSM